VARSSLALDEAGRLYVSSLRSRGSERFRTIEPRPTEAPARPADLSGLCGRVWDALDVARRPLSEQLLEQAFALSTEQFVDIALSLRAAGAVEVLYAQPDLSIFPQLVLASRIPSRDTPLDERRREIQVLLDSTLEGLGERGGLGRAWLRVEAVAVTDAAKLPGLVRKLVARAQRQGAPLLEYAGYELLMKHAEAARPRLEDRCHAAICMGEQHQQQGDLARADQIYSDALAFLESSRGQAVGRVAPLVADLVLKISELAQHRGEYKEASELVGDTLERYKDQLPAIHRGRLYLDLAWALLRLGRARESARHCEVTLNILDADRYPQEVARAYNQLGITHLEASNYNQSLINLQRSLVLREQVGDTIGVARVHNNLSVVYRSMGRLAEAERSLRRSLELKNRLGDSLGVAATQLNLGLLAVEQSNFDEARRCATECLHVARPFQHRSMEAEAYGLLGEAALGDGKYEEARSLLLKDLEICLAIKHETERLATLRRLVTVLLKQDDLDEAARQLEAARETLTRVKSRFEGAMLDCLEAQLLDRTGVREPAVDTYASAARVFGQLHRFDLQLDALVQRGRLELALGRTTAVRRTLGEARELVARHELHRIPGSYHELESRVGDTEPETAVSPAGAERCLDALAALVEDGGGARSDQLEPALRSIALALSCDEVHWSPGPDHPRVSLVRGTFSTRASSADLDLRLASVRNAESAVVVEEPWVLVRTTGESPGWLAVARGRALQAGELAFVRAVAGLLALMIARPPVAAPTVAVASGESEEGRHGMVGRSTAFREVLRMVDMVKDNDVTILLLGENGTGKDLVARAIHRAGGRRAQPFIAVNCAAVPATLLESELFGHEKGAFTSAHEQRIGVFERAHEGTIFLDEIGEMPLAMQAKLLRVLQDKSFTRVGGTRTIQCDVRVIAATNRDLMKEVEQGRFRMDLYYRLNVIAILLPPLRERIEDIGLLAQHFLERFSGEFRSPVHRITQEAIARLAEYPWPGNVRELENVIKNAMVFAEHSSLRVEDLPTSVLRGGGERRRQSVEEAVQAMIEAEDYSEDRPLMPRVELLVAHGVVRSVGNKARAARLLGITKPTLYNRLRRFQALYGQEDEESGSS
jgi:DNA-binding NtrC family response regulator/tetratricopeptide (TPR) repeat protein